MCECLTAHTTCSEPNHGVLSYAATVSNAIVLHCGFESNVSWPDEVTTLGSEQKVLYQSRIIHSKSVPAATIAAASLEVNTEI